MEVNIKQITSWKRALNAARFTVNKESIDKEPSDEWKDNILYAEHSPIRLIEYDIKIKGALNFVVNHLVRHWIGFIPFVGTHRSDRSEFKDEEVTRLSPTNVQFSTNAQALINVSRKRLCNCASKETRQTWEEVKEEMEKTDPIMAKHMVKECVYRGFCPELKSCGYVNTEVYLVELSNYRRKLEDPLRS